MPEDRLEVSNFAIEDGPIPVRGPDQILCRTVAVTIGAGQRAGLQGSASYAGAPTAGVVMGGSGIATVIDSDVAGIEQGDLVRAPTGWQQYSVHEAEAVSPVDRAADPANLLGPLGTNGLTAFFGLTDVGQVAEGDTVVVSAAAGSVGHMVGQMAKAAGARVVGIAGSDEKCNLLTEELGFDAAINRRSDDFRTEFKAATPDRINVYFDNTGGPILESALFRMATGGRIACCGVASQYDTATPGPGPRGVPGLLVNNRVTMRGFLVFDYADRYADARARISSWIDEGVLAPRTTVYEGLEAAPQAFVDLLGGITVGTTVVSVS